MMQELEIYLASPRGFCAGVKRAIAIVEEALAQFGSPIYVRHEIVHNKHVVEGLKQKGVIFIEDLKEIEDMSRPLIISAHGAAGAVFEAAKALGLNTIDATCPLVKHVHSQIKRLEKKAAEIIIIGQKKHAEIIGTAGQASNQEKIHIINSVEEAHNLELNTDNAVGVVTQTTLAIDDTKEIIDALKMRLPHLVNMDNNDICYATTHRQMAIKKLVPKCEMIIIIGSKNSSNSHHLKETALRNGVQKAILIDDVSELDFKELEGLKSLGISAGASAPEYLVTNLLEQIKKHYDKINIHNVIICEEKFNFKH